jgi:uncharacterized phiE125 gp8 family phage protein
MTTAPAEEPVSRDEAKLHLKIDTSPPTAHPDDSLVDVLIKAARRWCERYQNRAYVTQTWTLYLDRFPDEDYVEIPLPPLQCVESMTYKDAAGTTQTVSFLDPSGTAQLETDDYLVDVARKPGRLYLKYGAYWPSTLDEAQAVQIRFVAGYGLAADIPEEVKSAICLKLSDLYENRGDEAPGGRFEAAVESLLWPDRIMPI